MITMTIFKQDGSVYWVDHFPDLPTANTWVAEEKTRPYWDATYTIQFTDDSAAQAAIAAQIAAAQTAHAAKKAAILALRNTSGRTPAQAALLLEMFIDFLS